MFFLYVLFAFYIGRFALKGLQQMHQEEVKRYQKSVRFKLTDEEIDNIFDKYKR